MLSWRLPVFGLVFGLFFAALVFSFGPGIIAGPGAFFGLAVIVVGVAIFILEMPRNRLSSRLRSSSEWILIGVVWIFIAVIVLAILTLH